MKRNNVLRNTQGFTLVELAIVLVIIGLIIGGVLKGRELITNSKAKSVASQLQSMSGATGLYKDKFPTAGFPNISSLQSKGFLTGTGGMRNKFTGDVFLVPVSGSLPACAVSTKIPGEIAMMVDVAIDDGNPTTGSLRIYSTAPASLTVRPTTLLATAADVEALAETHIVLDFN